MSFSNAPLRGGNVVGRPPPEVGTIDVLIDFAFMSDPIPILIESSIEIAWDYLERTGELGDPAVASRVLLHSIETMVFSGERRRLMLANKAIVEKLPCKAGSGLLGKLTKEQGDRSRRPQTPLGGIGRWFSPVPLISRGFADRDAAALADKNAIGEPTESRLGVGLSMTALHLVQRGRISERDCNIASPPARRKRFSQYPVTNAPRLFAGSN
jgi:hypothetical protein